MTFDKALHDYLFNNGMFEQDVAKVVELVKSAKENEAMATRWEDDTEGYTPVMLAVMRVTANRYAVEYIDKNFPQAWFRPIFAGESK